MSTCVAHNCNVHHYLLTSGETSWSLHETFTTPQIGGKWALDLHFTLLLIPFSMLILPFLLGCFKYTFLRYGHLNTTSQSWKEAHFKYRKIRAHRALAQVGSKRPKEVHPSGSAIQAEKKGTSSVVLQVPFWATWDNCSLGGGHTLVKNYIP